MVRMLAIESSCDDTSVAVLDCNDKIICKSNEIASQIDKHKLFGGVVPEIASRMHIECISSLVDSALEKAETKLDEIDAISVTNSPGLIGSLLVGVNYAKGLASVLKIPLIPVHHIEGHICANYISSPQLKPPYICLVASGGHSTIVKVEDYCKFKIIAQTRDDAPGEAFDKISRVLGLGYPGGPAIQKLAESGNEDAFEFPKVKFDDSYDFSFSGVKTSVLNLIHKYQQRNEEIPKADIAASFQKCVCEVLANRLCRIAVEENIDTITLAGGVACNSVLRKYCSEYASQNNLTLLYPPPILCTDNAAMIGARGYYSYLKNEFADSSLNAYATKRILELEK